MPAGRSTTLLRSRGHLLPVAVLALALPVTASAQDPSTDAARARIEQQALPALDARRASAEARRAAGLRYFASEGSLAGAFPDLEGAPLNDPAWLEAQALVLQDRAAARAAERLASPPAGLDAAAARRWTGARTGACDAEDAADALASRLLAGLRAGLDAAPDLREDALSLQLATLRASRAAATFEPEEPGWEEAARQHAAWGEAEAALLRYRDAARRAATVPGDPTLARLVSADLDLLAALPAEAEDHGLVDRLGRVLPLLAPEARDGALAAIDLRRRQTLAIELSRLQAQADSAGADLARLDAEPTTVPLDVLEAQATRLAAEAADAAAALDALGQAVGVVAMDDEPSTAALELQVAGARLTLARQQAALAQARLERARSRSISTEAVQAPSSAEIDQDRARAAEEQRKAEEARATGDKSEADLRVRLQQIASASADAKQRQKDRTDAATATRKARQDRLAELRKDAAAAHALPPLDPDRQPRLDRVYLDLRSLTESARQDVADARSALADARHATEAALADLPESAATSTGDADLDELVNAWRQSLDEYRSTLDKEPVAARQELDDALATLQAVKAERRAIRAQASANARQTARREYLTELAKELREIPLIAGAGWRGTLATLRAVPGGLMDVTAVWAFLVRSVELLLLALGWLFVRSRAEPWLQSLADRLWKAGIDRGSPLGKVVERVEGWLEPGDPRRLVDDTTSLVRSLTDVLVAWALVRFFGDRFASFGVAAQVWLWMALLRAAPVALGLLLVPPGQDRPALWQVEAATLALTRRTVRTALVWAAVVAVAGEIAIALLDADRLFELIDQAGTLAGLVLALVLLAAWAPAVRAAVSHTEANRLTPLLTQDLRSPVMRAPQAAVGLLYLAGVWSVQLTGRMIEQRAGLAWIGSAMARRRLKETGDRSREPLGEEARRRIAAALDRPPAPEDERARVLATLAAWRQRHLRGMVAVTGDQGTGKSALLRGLAETVSDLPVRFVSVDRRRDTVAEALDWLGQVVGLEAGHGCTGEELVATLAERPASVYVIDDLHLLVLRAVGGFEGLREVLRVIHASSEEHFWVCGFHEPTWWYLRGVQQAVNLDLFKERIAMRALPAAHLEAWLVEGTRRAGYSPRFDLLVSKNTLGVNPERALERARAAFWRLVSDASMGNPQVALHLWLDSARQGDAPAEVVVTMRTGHGTDDLGALADLDLFALTSLVTHGGLEVHDLARTLNLGVAQCRATCRHLEGLGILAQQGTEVEVFAVTTPWLPAVERLLRNKSFLHVR